MAQWFVICLRIWRSLVQTGIITKKLLYWDWWEIFEIQNLHQILTSIFYFVAVLPLVKPVQVIIYFKKYIFIIPAEDFMAKIRNWFFYAICLMFSNHSLYLVKCQIALSLYFLCISIGKSCGNWKINHFVT